MSAPRILIILKASFRVIGIQINVNDLRRLRTLQTDYCLVAGRACQMQREQAQRD